MLCSQVGLGGSTHVGNNVILAGQVGVAGHLTIGDGAIATAQTGIPGDVAAGATVSGYPAIENRQWLRAVAVFNKLPELAKAIRKLNRNRNRNSRFQSSSFHFCIHIRTRGDSGWTRSKQFEVVEGGKSDEQRPISVLLLDDREENLAGALHHSAAEGLSHRHRRLHPGGGEQAQRHRYCGAGLPPGRGKIWHRGGANLAGRSVPRCRSSFCLRRWNASSAALPTCICSREAVRWTTWCRHCAALRRSGADVPWWSIRATSITRASSWRWATTW